MSLAPDPWKLVQRLRDERDRALRERDALRRAVEKYQKRAKRLLEREAALISVARPWSIIELEYRALLEEFASEIPAAWKEWE